MPTRGEFKNELEWEKKDTALKRVSVNLSKAELKRCEDEETLWNPQKFWNPMFLDLP